MQNRWLALGLGVVLGSVVMLPLSSPLAQVKKGKSRPAATRHLMKALVFPTCSALGETLKTGPADEKAWDLALAQASGLNELSFVLMDDGRCPDAVWAGATKELREGSASVVAALEKKDIEAARAAFKNLTGACTTCHNAHRPAKKA